MMRLDLPLQYRNIPTSIRNLVLQMLNRHTLIHNSTRLLLHQRPQLLTHGRVFIHALLKQRNP